MRFLGILDDRIGEKRRKRNFCERYFVIDFRSLNIFGNISRVKEVELRRNSVLNAIDNI